MDTETLAAYAAQQFGYNGDIESQVAGFDFDTSEFDSSPEYSSLVSSPQGTTWSANYTNPTPGPLTITLFNGTALPAGIVETPATPGWGTVAYSAYLGTHPAAVSAFRVRDTAAGAVIAGMAFNWTKATPYGGTAGNSISVNQNTSEMDFNPAVSTFSARYVLDGQVGQSFVLIAGGTVTITIWVTAMRSLGIPLRNAPAIFPGKTSLQAVQPVRMVIGGGHPALRTK